MIEKLKLTMTKSFTNKIVLVNVILFILTSLIPGLSDILALHSTYTNTNDFQIWQPLTHMFVHANFIHIFFNMLILFQFGNFVENEMSRYFKYDNKNLYTITYVAFGLFAALMHVFIMGESCGSMVGASGAVSGIFALYCLLYPNKKVYLYFLIPIKCTHMLYLFTGIELFCGLFMSDNIGHWAHLGGAFAGYIFWVYEFKMLKF